ncbi:alpha-amylase family glycosyl hydrolase [Chitinimonas lacunae]|uniref:Alpha-amylase family glycosyl hydrolase n=1 Tax=Chitinimonas lacunae TaxID=1963018 RepID=A0ABV8MKA9_9NEIS
MNITGRIGLSLLALLLAACATQAPTQNPTPTVAVTATAAAEPTAHPMPAARPASFADNPIVYFIVTDRFRNGNRANDHSYGRLGDGQSEIGTFHGGDLAGITEKLREGYFRELGVNALWITAPYEQIHGWVVGGNKEFRHYAYHGYYPLDFTVLDRNMGTPEELREMVDTAHGQGIRVLFDVVMNHPGYADIATLSRYLPEVLWKGWQAHGLSDYHSWIDYNSFAFTGWWGPDWIRSGLPGYREGGRDDRTMQLAYLPDFRTEETKPVDLPPLLKKKPDTRAVPLPNTPVRGYLIKWLSDWVREYGIDGFRCDTAKHVELAAWRELKAASSEALAQWKAANPHKKIDDAPFWMTGEVWGHGVERSAYFDHGFDSLINFDFQDRPLEEPRQLNQLYSDYAARLREGGFDVLSYLSSHDTRLYRRDRMMAAATALLLAPGGVQIFYGDESGRQPGPASAGDPQQATRSDMNWATLDQALLAHFRKLGQFRARHRALARGSHRMLGEAPYTFGRIDERTGDRVVVALGADGTVSLPVGDLFREGERVRDAYSDASATVSAGRVRLDAAGAVVLLERAS